MARRRRSSDTFGLAFLDVICCGFGAVILFYTIISARSGLERLRRTEDLTAHVNQLDEQVLSGTRNLALLRNTLEKTENETASAGARTRQILAEVEASRRLMSAYDETSLARRERIEKLKTDIRALEEGTRRLEGGSLDEAPPGQEVRAFRDRGGDRRYITGLRLRGKRILILVDRSASMLHEDLVNIIVLRNSSEPTKRMATKWRRAVGTVSWLVAQLPPGSQFQIYSYNAQARPLVEGSAGKWHDAGDAKILARNIEALQALVPEGGTSLINAFAAAKELDVPPDQIVLVTDGLPTQGRMRGRRDYIDAAGRAQLFDEALENLPGEAPVDIVLLPLKGENPAAHRYWRLARQTGGVLFMPSKDWP